MRLAALLATAVLTITLPAHADIEDPRRLPIGDPARRDAVSPVVLDAIVDTATGDRLSPDELAVRLDDVRILFVGEEHTNIDVHRAQDRIIRALHQHGRPVVIALEMYPYTRQKYLDRWIAGDYSETEFLEASGWTEHWGYRWAYYRDIFLFAREHGLQMTAINAPRDVVRNVRLEGFAQLSPEDAAHIPTEVDTDNDEYRRLFRAYFSADDSIHAALSDEQWDGMFRAQCTWDAVMGFNAMQAARAEVDAIVVVLIGAGHVAYGLGAQRQIEAGFDGRIASLLPTPIADADGTRVNQVQRSYADFVWGLPATRSPEYPVLGVSLAGKIGEFPTRIIQVDEASVAQRAGLVTGDILIAFDGQPLESALALRRAMDPVHWGDKARIGLVRDEQELIIDVAFRR